MWGRIGLVWFVFAAFVVATSCGATSALSRSHRICSQVSAGYARCHALVLTEGGEAAPLTTAVPQGYGPSDYRAAYGPVLRAATPTAVVTAYDAPRIQSDLAAYSKAFGLPLLPPCTSRAQIACFAKVSQTGSADLPAVSGSWALEASLDAETLHGMCPSCRITLVEARSSSLTNLSAAAQEAAQLGAKVISNSYGGPESAAQAAYDHIYGRAGTTMVVSSGDSGYGTSYPAAAPGVVAVGGTTLKMRGLQVSSERAWEGSGSGCSLYEPKPTWQKDKRCKGRTIADVAADADPSTGAAIYDSYPVNGHSGWFVVGGTSLAAPLIGGMLAASGNFSGQPAGFYSHPNWFRDIVAGSNGGCLSYYCIAATGYDGPTGLGTPVRW